MWGIHLLLVDEVAPAIVAAVAPLSDDVVARVPSVVNNLYYKVLHALTLNGTESLFYPLGATPARGDDPKGHWGPDASRHPSTRSRNRGSVPSPEPR